jgi:hypothetical protein
VTREEWMQAYDALWVATCACSISDMDGKDRQDVMNAMQYVRNNAVRGFDARDTQRRCEEDARILKAYRDGRLVEAK